MRIIKNLKKIGEVSCPSTAAFCVIVCKRVAINMKRDSHDDKYVDMGNFLEQIPDENINIEEETLRKIDVEVLTNKLSQLPDMYREMIYLYYGNGFSQKRISKILGISHENARKRLQRARKMLLSAIKGDD
jgi:RNA polymerase sigma-70 factor (ECF subfamily)